MSAPEDLFSFSLLRGHFYLVSLLLSPTIHTKKTKQRINHTVFLTPLTIIFVYLFRKKIFRQDWFLNWQYPLSNSTWLLLRTCPKLLKVPADPPSFFKADPEACWQTHTSAHLSSSPAPRPPDSSPPLPDSCRQLNWSFQTIHVTAMTKHDFKGEIPQCFAQPAQLTIKRNRARSAR